MADPVNSPDTALVLSALWHVALGLALSALTLASGMGLYRIATFKWRAESIEDEILYAFPVGIASLAAISAIALALPMGRVAAPILLLATITPACLYRSAEFTIDARRAIGVTVRILPFSTAFGIFMALLWHGPTSTLAARPLADMVYYAGIMNAFRENFLPLPNLAVLGDSISLSNTVPSMIGAAVSLYIDVDPFLFLAGWGGAFFIYSFALSLYMVTPRSSVPANIKASVIAFMLGSLYDPSWMVNTAPATLTFPLFFLAWRIVQKNSYNINQRLADALILTVGSALGKVTAIIPVVILALMPPKIERFDKLKSAAVSSINWKTFAFIAFISLYSFYMIWRFGGIVWVYFISAPIGPFTFQNFSSIANLMQKTNLGFVLRDLGSVWLALTAALYMRGPLRFVIIVCVATFLIFPLFFTTPLLGAVVLTGISILNNNVEFRRNPFFFMAPAILLCSATMVVDPGSLQTSVVWLFCMGGACLVAIDRDARSYRVIPIAGGVGCAVVVLSISGGIWNMRTGDPRSYGSETWLTPEFRDIWLSVRDHTPKSALVFTDRTGTAVDLQTGANFYAVLSERQSYVSGLLNSSIFVNEDKRRERLSRNDRVLAGTASPDAFPETRPYTEFFAVVETSKKGPPGSRLVYENKDFKLLELRACLKTTAQQDC